MLHEGSFRLPLQTHAAYRERPRLVMRSRHKGLGKGTSSTQPTAVCLGNWHLVENQLSPGHCVPRTHRPWG